MPNAAILTIAGHLGRDAELKEVGSTNVCEFSVAVNAKQKGEDSTMWFRVALWGKRGESLSQYLVKGKAVLVSGRFTVREYTGKSGDAYSLEVNASEVEFLGGNDQADTPERTNAPSDEAEIPF